MRGLALATFGALLWWTVPAWSDDWDGIGFVESIGDFDVARFRPHPPGYPVYVALLRLAAAVVHSPMRACALVAVASGLIAIAFVWSAARRAGERAAWMAAILVAAAPGVWRAFGGVGSEAPALACAAACVWGLLASRPRSAGAPCGSPAWAGAAILGLAAGVGLGIRLSWGPFFVAALAVVARGQRIRAWLAAAAACITWGVPFVASQGAGRLARLYAEHFAGHSSRWGGTILSQPGSGIVRCFWFARDLVVDGFGAGSDPLGLLIAVLVGVAIAHALAAWRAAGWHGARTAIALAAPYAIWIGLGQNLRDQPRHVLPLLASLAAGIGLSVATKRKARFSAWALAMAVSARTVADAHARRTIPPAGQQLVELARMQPSPDRLLVFGAASVRFFETTELASRALPVGSLGDALMDLTRVDELPNRVWVTSEIGDLSASEWRLEPIATLCRPPRIDRRMPCLDVFAWRLPFLPSQ